VNNPFGSSFPSPAVAEPGSSLGPPPAAAAAAADAADTDEESGFGGRPEAEPPPGAPSRRAALNVWSESSSSSSECEEDGEEGREGEDGAVEGDDGAVVSSSSSAVASESDDGGSFRLRWEAPPPEVAPEWDGDGAARPSMRGDSRRLWGVRVLREIWEPDASQVFRLFVVRRGREMMLSSLDIGCLGLQMTHQILPYCLVRKVKKFRHCNTFVYL